MATQERKQQQVNIRETEIEMDDHTYHMTFIRLRDDLTTEEIKRIDSFEAETTLDFVDGKLVGLTTRWTSR